MLTSCRTAKRADFFKITSQQIRIESVIRKVLDVDSGAIVTFIGTVRRLSRGREVKYLEYEAYKKLALREFRSISDDIKEKWNVKKVAIVHRTGKLKLKEASVVIAVSASHRDEAYQASRYIIERLKKRVPIWKKEVWDGGEEWIQGS
ncbi:MAG: molybdenum cofactor biosynthesis protein MoaE [Thermodesulfobacteriota bacterium]